MPAARLVRLLVMFATLVVSASAPAEGPTRAKHAASTASAARGRGKTDSNQERADAAASGYLAGKQALLGWHTPATSPVPRDARGRPMLALTTINRGESLAIASDGEDGGFGSADLDRVAHLLRAMGGEEHPVDPRTLGLVYRIQVHFGVPEVRVVSGYRVPKPGSHSNHGKGRAMDLVVPGVADEEVARFARGLGFVGVGVYPTSQFVHVDVRPRSYFWIDYSGPRMKNKESCILPEIAAQGDAAAVARGQAPIEPFVVSMDVDAALRARGAPPAPPLSDDEEDED